MGCSSSCSRSDDNVLIGYINPKLNLEASIKSAKRHFDRFEEESEFSAPVDRMQKWMGKIRKCYQNLQIPSQRILRQITKLEIRNVSLIYREVEFYNDRNRIESVNETLSNTFQAHVNQWIGRHPFVSHWTCAETGQVTLFEAQQRAIDAALRYPLFIRILIADRGLSDRFFKWALVDNCPVEPFIEFFKTCDKIRKATLHKRIGYFSISVLQIEQSVSRRKILTLPFESSPGNIVRLPVQHPGAIIPLSNATALTVAQIFHVFSQKKERAGSLEMLNGVISPWDYFGSLGTLANSAPAGSEWWWQLPVFEVFTEAEMRDKYGVTESLSPNQWIRVIRSNRETPTMDIAGTHGFIEFLIPRSDGNYQLFPFTFIATQFTTGWADWPKIDIALKIQRLAKTERGQWAYPDETVTYSHREQAAFPTIISEEMGRLHMETLRGDVLNALGGNEVFQLTVKNCAGTIERQIQRVYTTENIPDVFGTSMLDNTPREPLGMVFRWLKQRPRFIVRLIFWYFGLVLGAWKGIFIRVNNKLRYACVMNTPFYRDWRTSNAAKLFQKINQGEVRGVIWCGHTKRNNID